MQKVLSVSVAAYNVEKFIEQCLDSFIDPAILDRVEVLVTDDGSKDRTPEIVSAYEKKYPGTFRLISQKNAGRRCDYSAFLQRKYGMAVHLKHCGRPGAGSHGDFLPGYAHED